MPYDGKFQAFEDIIREIMVVYKHDERPWLIGYSGGKDSTLLVALVYATNSDTVLVGSLTIPLRRFKLCVSVMMLACNVFIKAIGVTSSTSSTPTNASSVASLFVFANVAAFNHEVDALPFPTSIT